MAQGASEEDVRQQACPSDELEQLCEAVRRKWLGRTGDRMLAEDIAQETALIVLERFAGDGLEDPAKLGAFFHQTARYLHIGAVRQGQRTLATTPDRFDDYATSDRSPEQQLQVNFPIPDFRADYDAKPMSYIGGLVGHEGEGSLFVCRGQAVVVVV